MSRGTRLDLLRGLGLGAGLVGAADDGAAVAAGHAGGLGAAAAAAGAAAAEALVQTGRLPLHHVQQQLRALQDLRRREDRVRVGKDAIGLIEVLWGIRSDSVGKLLIRIFCTYFWKGGLKFRLRLRVRLGPGLLNEIMHVKIKVSDMSLYVLYRS